VNHTKKEFNTKTKNKERCHSLIKTNGRKDSGGPYINYTLTPLNYGKKERVFYYIFSLP